jgi:hypothetical protein
MSENVKRFAPLFIAFFISINPPAFAQSKYDLVRPVRFERGASGATITGVLIYGAKHFYRLKAQKGQTMSVKLIVANSIDKVEIGFTVDSLQYPPGRDTRILDGIDPRGGNQDWSGELPVSGEYEIVVHNPPVSPSPVSHPIRYKLEVFIKGDAQSQPDSALVAAIRETYSDQDYGDVRYFLNWFDLNGDGEPEAIVYVVGPRVCGSGGCDTHIFARREGGYNLVSTISLTRPLIIASQRRAHGWNNLIVFVAGGGVLSGYYAELQFDGRTYPENPTVEPAKRVEGQPRGEPLIKRFRSYMEGKPLNPQGGSDKR